MPQKHNQKSLSPIQNPEKIFEDNFSEIVENLPVMYYSLEAEPPHRLLKMSCSFDLLGYTLEEWRNNHEIWVNTIHSKDKKRVLSQVKRALRDNLDLDIEYRVVGRNNRTQWVRNKACSVFGKNGEVVCRQGIIIDITEQKTVEYELKKREALYRTISRNLPRTGVLVFDHDLRFTFAEGEELEKSGFSSNKIEGKTLFEVFPDELVKTFERYYKVALVGGFVNFEHSHHGKIHQYYFLPLKNGKNEVFAGMSLWQDVTELRKSDEKIKESEKRFREIFDGASDLIYSHDLEGRFLTMNKAAERVFGYSKEEILSLNIRDVVDPDQFEDVLKKIEARLPNETTESVYELTCITKSGERVILEINSSLIVKNGKPIGVQGIARNVTERKNIQRRIQESESELRALFSAMNDIVLVISKKGVILKIPQTRLPLPGVESESIVGKNLSEIFPREKAAFFRRNIKKAIKEQQSNRIEYFLEIEGKTSWFSANISPISNDSVVVVARDVTSRRMSEETLRISEEKYRHLSEGIMHQVWTANPDGLIDYLNKRGMEYLGINRERLETIWTEVFHPEDLPNAMRRWKRALETGEKHEVEFRLRRYDGEFRWHRSVAVPSRDEDGKITKWFGTNTDIHDQKIAEYKLSHIAKHDSLTNLPNRSKFMNHLERVVKRKKYNSNYRFAVLFLDVDRFKVINDSLGHLIGDRLLQAFAERLESCVRPSDVVARLGGDEFTILLNDLEDFEDCVRITNRLIQKITEPFVLNEYEVFTSASIGIVLSDEVDREPKDYLRDADTAMYRAKGAGKARYEIFNNEMHVQNMTLLRVENDLRRAIERNEFTVFYQPIVSLETVEIVEFEALLRWQHPQYGLVSPAEFIKVAEETGLIIPIGKIILEEACRQVAKWQKGFPRGNPLAIGVNLSSKQLMHPNLIAQIKEILRITKLNPKSLRLEVTETEVMENSDAALSVLNELKDLGILLSTDDFGTGYSSLSYLHRFPFDCLKIDRSFIGEIDSNKKSLEIVRTILMLAENLSMRVVAEGIETAGQLSLLQAQGCKLGQGYYFSKPIEAEKVENLLSSKANEFFIPSFCLNPEDMISTEKVQ